MNITLTLHPLDRPAKSGDLCLNTSYLPGLTPPLVRGFDPTEGTPNTHLKPQSLLFLSEEESPKRIGDWGYSEQAGLVQIEGGGTTYPPLQKVMASTDPLSGVGLPSPKIVRKYMLQYNISKPIDRVSLEFTEETKSVNNGDGSYSKETRRLPEKDEDGFILFRQISIHTYNEIEVVEMLLKAYIAGYGDRDAGLQTFHGLPPHNYIREIFNT